MSSLTFFLFLSAAHNSHVDASATQDSKFAVIPKHNFKRRPVVSNAIAVSSSEPKNAPKKNNHENAPDDGERKWPAWLKGPGHLEEIRRRKNGRGDESSKDSVFDDPQAVARILASFDFPLVTARESRKEKSKEKIDLKAQVAQKSGSQSKSRKISDIFTVRVFRSRNFLEHLYEIVILKRIL